MESVSQGSPATYTNPSATNWTWDTHTGFPVKASIAGRFAALTTLVAGGMIAITAAVVAIVISVGSQGDNNSNNGTTGIENSDEVVVEQLDDDPNTSQLTSNENPIVIPNELNLICKEGDYCSVTVSLSSEPQEEVILKGIVEDCQSFDIPREHIVASWGSDDWSISKGQMYLARSDGEPLGDRVCQIRYLLESGNNQNPEEAFTLNFIIKDTDKRERPPEQPDPTPEQPDPTPSQEEPTAVPEGGTA